MNSKWKYLSVISLSALVTLAFFFGTQNDKLTRLQEFHDNYKIYALDLPEKAIFAGETVPLNIADVRERFDREILVNTYWQSQTLLLLKRKERWFPLIEPILKSNNIPDDFKYLALAESGLTNVVSPSGAAGYWQFLEATGTRYGLEINSEVDERYNVEKATHAACSYFKEAYAVFNNWSLVAASYNMGIDGIKKQLEKQGVSGYYDLLLVEETSRYLFRIISLKEICKDPTMYGFHLRKRDFYEPFNYSTVLVDSSISDLASFARKKGINYKELKLLNPWLRTSTLSNKLKKQYKIYILNKNKPGTIIQSNDTSWIKSFPGKEIHQE